MARIKEIELSPTDFHTGGNGGRTIANNEIEFIDPIFCRNGFLLLFVFIAWLLTAGCFRAETQPVIDGYRFKEVQLDNVKFVPLVNVGTVQMQTAKNYWLKKGEQLQVKWETFETHWEREGANCTFPDNVEESNCIICDLCNNTTSRIQCLQSLTFDRGDVLKEYENFILENDKPKIIDRFDTADPTAGCTSSNRFIFTPETNAVFLFMNPNKDEVEDGKTIAEGEAKVHVLKSGQTDTVAYQLTMQQIDGRNYWIWVVPGDPWFENFSPGLRVTNIRVLKGSCNNRDPLSGKCMATSQDEVVRPSRILFLPAFDGLSVSNYQGGEAAHRCYSNPPGTDGSFFNLDQCRETYNVGSLGTNPKFATPTFEFFPANALSKITWLVEFNTAERGDINLTTTCDPTTFVGCDAPDPLALPELIIEFKIQAN